MKEKSLLHFVTKLLWSR